MRKLLYIAGALIILLVTGYFIINALIRRKIEQGLQTLPSSIKLNYGSLHADILRGSLVLNDLALSKNDQGQTQQLSIEKLTIHGINFFALAASRKNFTIGSLTLTGVHAEEKKRFSMEGSLELDSLHITNLDSPTDNIQIGSIMLNAKDLYYLIPGAQEALHCSGVELDSKQRLLRADTVKLIPTVGKLELGRIKGEQVDYVEAVSEGVKVEGLDVMALLKHQLLADGISLQHNSIFVFRDRRLPLPPTILP
jgi:hypothetical protein